MTKSSTKDLFPTLTYVHWNSSLIQILYNRVLDVGNDISGECMYFQTRISDEVLFKKASPGSWILPHGKRNRPRPLFGCLMASRRKSHWKEKLPYDLRFPDSWQKEGSCFPSSPPARRSSAYRECRASEYASSRKMRERSI